MIPFYIDFILILCIVQYSVYLCSNVYYTFCGLASSPLPLLRVRLLNRYLLVCIIQYTVVFLYSTDQSFSMKIIIIDTSSTKYRAHRPYLKKRQYNYKNWHLLQSVFYLQCQELFTTTVKINYLVAGGRTCKNWFLTMPARVLWLLSFAFGSWAMNELYHKTSSTKTRSTMSEETLFIAESFGHTQCAAVVLSN